jgi:hypothetical protein
MTLVLRNREEFGSCGPFIVSLGDSFEEAWKMQLVLDRMS